MKVPISSIQKCIKLVVTVLRTIFIYFLIACVVIPIMTPLLLLIVCLPHRVCQDSDVIFYLLDLLYKGIMGAALVPISVVGKEYLSTEPAIIVANHQSSLDILFIGSLLDGYPHFWYALSYYANIPVLGSFIRCIGMPLDRSTPTGAGRALMRGIDMIAGKNRHVVLFPEGGRFNDGRVHDFLRGFAIIARKTGRPVIPIFMPYNGIVYPPHSFLIDYHRLKAVIGGPFMLQENETDEAFIARVHAWFDQQAAEMKSRN